MMVAKVPLNIHLHFKLSLPAFIFFFFSLSKTPIANALLPQDIFTATHRRQVALVKKQGIQQH